MQKSPGKSYAAIDIGTNTIRSLVVAVSEDGRYRVLDDERAPVRLGEGMTASGKIAKPTIARALEALRRMKVIAEGRGVESITVVATSALRKASNRSDFVRRVERETGLKVRVISGAEEARLAFESARRNFDLSGKKVVVADIGGGSTEVIFAAENHIEQIHSLEIGAVALSETYLRSDPTKPREFRSLRRFLKHLLGLEFRGKPFEPDVMIVSGGTASALAQVAMALKRESYTQVHGYVLTRADIEHLLGAVLQRTIAERRELAGLSPDRADIIAAGIVIIRELMVGLRVNHIMVSARGLRDGLMARIARKASGTRGPERPLTRMTGVLEFARSCSFEQAHSEHVARLALEIFDGVAASLRLPQDARDLLHAAALLHDVGYYISYARHHKHSYHLILHADLPGFTPREVEIIANLARYHRRASPRRKHRSFARLPKEDQRIVLALAPILRVADGLDRSHAQVVESVRCAMKDGKVVIEARAVRDATPEVWTAREKGALFEKLYRVPLKLRAREARPAAAAGKGRGRGPSGDAGARDGAADAPGKGVEVDPLAAKMDLRGGAASRAVRRAGGARGGAGASRPARPARAAALRRRRSAALRPS